MMVKDHNAMITRHGKFEAYTCPNLSYLVCFVRLVENFLGIMYLDSCLHPLHHCSILALQKVIFPLQMVYKARKCVSAAITNETSIKEGVSMKLWAALDAESIIEKLWGKLALEEKEKAAAKEKELQERSKGCHPLWVVFASNSK